jgi:2-polyprenyl-3-methyl-5-hydroxy-6-metoxy-1,4-benzoquinol methylase
VPLVVDPEGVEPSTIRELVDVRGLRVADVGCGDGRLSFVCAEQGATVFGIDPDEDGIADAREHTPKSLRGRVRFEIGDAAEVELPKHEFDLALFSWSL